MLINCQEILEEADANGDGFFEFDEFMTIGPRVGSKFMDRELKKFDLDGDGYITKVKDPKILPCINQI